MRDRGQNNSIERKRRRTCSSKVNEGMRYGVSSKMFHKAELKKSKSQRNDKRINEEARRMGEHRDCTLMDI